MPERELEPAWYRIYVNDTRTVMVRVWDDGIMEVATREDPGMTWGPPVRVRETEVAA